MNYEILDAGKKLSRKELNEAKAFISEIPAVKGEVRLILKCCECGNLIGRRFIPYSFGRGATFNLCMCYSVGNNAKTKDLIQVKD